MSIRSNWRSIIITIIITTITIITIITTTTIITIITTTITTDGRPGAADRAGLPPSFEGDQRRRFAFSVAAPRM